MKLKLVVLGLTLLALWPAVANEAQAARRPSIYANPVINADFPDPDVLRGPDGYFYAYATQTEREGKWIDIQVARSNDLVHWRLRGDALPVPTGREAEPRKAAFPGRAWERG